MAHGMMCEIFLESLQNHAEYYEKRKNPYIIIVAEPEPFSILHNGKR
jgi:hypothetical protein